MEEEFKLLPCPFCGGEATTHAYYSAYSCDSSFTAVGCNSCGVFGQMWDNRKELKEAVEHWNTRAESNAKV